MKIFVGFEEMSGQVRERFGQDVTFNRVSDKDLKVTYRKKALLVTIPVSVEITLADIKAESVALRYHAFVGLDQIISMVLNIIVGKHPDLKDALHIEGDTCTIKLTEIKNAQAFTQNFGIKDISFENEGINVLLDFKTPEATPSKKETEKKTVVPEKIEDEVLEVVGEDGKKENVTVVKDKNRWIPDFKSKLQNYADKFTPKDYLDKISKYGKDMGLKLVYSSLLLFYALTDGKVPVKDKLIVTAALGYVVLPIDLVPDWIIGGFFDDASIVGYALSTIRKDITPEIESQAFNKLKEFFHVEEAPKVDF